MSTSDISCTTEDQEINHRNDVILRQLAPDAYGPYGFDGHRAQLLVRGMVIPANVKEALSKRCEEELTDRASARFAKSLDCLNPPSMKQKSKATVLLAPLPCDHSDRESWAEETTRELVRLHAQRLPFKQIAEQIEGKQVKSCQEHFYRVMKVEKWQQLHQDLRKNHNVK